MKSCLYVGFLALAPSLVLAQTVSPKCAGNLLATAVPPAKEVSGYQATALQCVRGQATKIYAVGESEVTIKLMDAEGQLAGTSEANDPQQVRDMAKNMGKMSVDGARSNAEAGRGVIDAITRNPQIVQSRGGPDYVPFMLPMGANGQLVVLVPTKDEANGDFLAQGTYGTRYLVAIDIKQSRAGKGAQAARATIEPFLRTMDFSHLP